MALAKWLSDASRMKAWTSTGEQHSTTSCQQHCQVPSLPWPLLPLDPSPTPPCHCSVAGDPFEQLVNSYLDNRRERLSARLSAGARSGMSRFTAFVKKHRRTESAQQAAGGWGRNGGLLMFLMCCLVLCFFLAEMLAAIFKQVCWLVLEL